MSLDLSFGSKIIHLEFSQALEYTLIDLPRGQLAEESSEEIVERTLNNSQPRLHEFIDEKDRIVIVVSDYTRPTGSHIYTPIIVKHLLSFGLAAESIVIVISLGLHRPATEEEKRGIVGEWLYDRIRVENHDPSQNLVSVRGTGFNRSVMDADKLILTGVVTFHPMAGYSGGYKSLLPGVASRDSIVANHRKYFENGETNPLVGSAKVEGNPIRDDIEGKCRGIKPMYCVNAVLSENKKIAYCSAGEVGQVWKDCSRYVYSNKGVALDLRYDCIVASAGGAPSDYSFYQCMKVLNNASGACNGGGDLIIVAECYAGWEISTELFSWFLLPLEEVAHKLKEDFRMDGLAVYMALKVIRSYNVYFYSSLPAAEVERIGMVPLYYAEEIEDILGKNAKKRKKIGVMPYAAQTLPIVQRER